MGVQNMSGKLKIFLAVFVVAILMAQFAYGQSRCGPHLEITDILKSVYGEKMIGMGVMTSKSITEIWVNYKTGSWTVLTTSSNGTSCIKAGGVRWIEPL